MKRRCYIILLFVLLFSYNAKAQKIAGKTNIIYDVSATVNVGLEVGLSDKWTLDMSGSFNGWSTSGEKKWKHWMMQPEARYWLCDKFSGHFFGFHLHGGQYNIGGVNTGLKFLGTDFSQLKNYRYQGWFVGTGIGYGYSWILDRHWNLEAEIGLGYSYTRYDKFECAGCGEKVEKGRTHHYVGPTKAALNLIYVF